MNSVSLANATSVLVIFTSNISLLYYQFNGTTGANARMITDALTPSVSTSCQTSFPWNSTAEGSAYTNVTYVGPGKQNLKQHTESLMSQCLASDLAGFLLVFPNVTEGSDATAQIAATKTSGGSNWTYSMGASYASNVSSLNPHTMDILDMLRVSAIAPSPNALSTGFYFSTVAVTALSNTPETFLSSQPGNASSPLQRGWLMMTAVPPPGALAANFYFGNNASPVSSLTLTHLFGYNPSRISNDKHAHCSLGSSVDIAVPHVFLRRQQEKVSD